MRKGQIAVFIIIALGIVLLIGILIVLRGLGNKTAGVKDMVLQGQEVTKFVEGCLQASTMAGLQLLGEQGGVIYQNQGGFVPDTFADDRFTANVSDQRVWYSITPDSVTYGKSCAAADLSGSYAFQACPSVTFPFYSEDSDLIMFGSDGTFKTAHDKSSSVVDNMRLLNRLNLPGLYERDGPQNEVEWIKPLLAPHMKIRPNLAEFIKNNITECLNFSEFARKGLVISRRGAASVNPEFSEEFTRVEMNYPLLVVDNLTNQSLTLNKFSVRTNIRFGKIYKYMNDILRKEAEDYSYNLSSAEPFDGISLESLDKETYKKRVDLVVFVDTKSIITNQTNTSSNYRFIGAIPNSPPAISYIHYRNLSAVPGLAGFLRTRCGFEDTPDALNMLAKHVFEQMNRNEIECLFNAYANVTKLQGKYSPVYDPDGDKLAWDFKTSDCAWNVACQYDNESEFDHGMKTEIVLRFYEEDNPIYQDFLTIPLKLYNYAPNSITAECVGPSYGSYVYLIGAANQETGSNNDEMILRPPRVISGGISVEGYEEVDVTQGMVWWHVRFANVTGTHLVEFTVEDSFGAANSSEIPIKIPC